MASQIDFAPAAARELQALDAAIRKRILRFLAERVAPLEDPRILAKALRGTELGEFWRYRVGDYRLICSIEDGHLRVLVLRIGHRREIYR